MNIILPSYPLSTKLCDLNPDAEYTGKGILPHALILAAINIYYTELHYGFIFNSRSRSIKSVIKRFKLEADIDIECEGKNRIKYKGAILGLAKPGFRSFLHVIDLLEFVPREDKTDKSIGHGIYAGNEYNAVRTMLEKLHDIHHKANLEINSYNGTTVSAHGALPTESLEEMMVRADRYKKQILEWRKTIIELDSKNTNIKTMQEIMKEVGE